MVYRVRRARARLDDLEAIFDHLFAAHLDLGASPAEALDRAEARLIRIEADLAELGRVPHRGTLWPEVMPGLRWVTVDRAIFWFIVDEAAGEVRVLAVFFGGQDHKTRLLERIRQGGDG